MVATGAKPNMPLLTRNQRTSGPADQPGAAAVPESTSAPTKILTDFHRPMHYDSNSVRHIEQQSRGSRLSRADRGMCSEREQTD
jgi:hypothetical protein